MQWTPNTQFADGHLRGAYPHYLEKAMKVRSVNDKIPLYLGRSFYFRITIDVEEDKMNCTDFSIILIRFWQLYTPSITIQNNIQNISPILKNCPLALWVLSPPECWVNHFLISITLKKKLFLLGLHTHGIVLCLASSTQDNGPMRFILIMCITVVYSFSLPSSITLCESNMICLSISSS